MEQQTLSSNKTAMNWRERVIACKSMPEVEEMPADVAWARLQQRYANAPVKKSRVMFYRVAAAGLLLLIILPFILNKKPGTPIPGEEVRSLVNGKDAPIKAKILITGTPADTRVCEKQQDVVRNTKTQKPSLATKSGPLEITGAMDQKQAPTLIRIQTIDSVKIQPIAISSQPEPGHKPPTIVQLNEINAEQPARQYDETKLRRFLRKYDVDAPPRMSTAGGKNESSIISDIN